MDIAEALRRSDELERWMGPALDGSEFPANDRTRIAVALYDLAQETHRAIALLVKHKHYGPAFTLLRPTFETTVRAAWIFHCASDDQVAKFQNEEVPPFGQLIGALKSTPYGEWFGDLKDHAWSPMCSYAHGGFFQAVRRISSESVEPMYQPGEIVEVVRISGFIALLAALECATMAKKEAVVGEAIARIDVWYEDLFGPLSKGGDDSPAQN